MIMLSPEVVARHEFLAVVLADPELLDLAFGEVIASWEAEPPPPPTLVTTSERRVPRSGARRAGRDRQCWHAWVRAIPRPKVARSPPEGLMAPGPGCVDPETNPQQ